MITRLAPSAAAAVARPAALAATSLLAAALIGAAFLPPSPSSAQTPAGNMPPGHPIVARPAEINACTGCHGANLKGKANFSPSLSSKTGVLKEYNQATFARVMDTGVTNDGGHVKRPMPVFHYSNAVSNKIYAYLKASVQ